MFRTKALKAEYAKQIRDHISIGFPLGSVGSKAFEKDLRKLNLFTIEQLSIWMSNHKGISAKRSKK